MSEVVGCSRCAATDTSLCTGGDYARRDGPSEDSWTGPPQESMPGLKTLGRERGLWERALAFSTPHLGSLGQVYLVRLKTT
ncbi:hypothetical protein T484DRAFT_1931748 [Baffinella frigidus]|nr:hypothetical protein T484DRAFT_1931748 [Cryptophyta sp. CCMP2293]